MTQPSDDWYRPEISRKELKELMTRNDATGSVIAEFGDIILDGINALVEKREVGAIHQRTVPELVVRESTRNLS
jgi:hypothetical protein